MSQLLFKRMHYYLPAPTLYPSALPGKFILKQNTQIKAVGIFFFLFRNRNFPQWAAFRDGALAHHPILVNYVRSPSPNHGIIISLKRRKERKRRKGKRERKRKERDRTKERKSQNLKGNPTSCEEILVLMSFLRLPQVFSPGYPNLRL